VCIPIEYLRYVLFGRLAAVANRFSLKALFIVFMFLFIGLPASLVSAASSLDFTIEFSGTANIVNDVPGALSELPVSGNVISGSFAVDPDNPTDSVVTTNLRSDFFAGGNFEFNADLAGIPLDPTQLYISIGDNYTVQTQGGPAVVDLYSIIASGITLPGYSGEVELTIILIDESASLLTSTDFLTVLPNLSQWDGAQIELASPGMTPDILVFGNVDALQVVPEPAQAVSTLAMTLVIALLTYLKRRQKAVF